MTSAIDIEPEPCNFIQGKWVEPSTKQWVDAVNPARPQEILGSIADSAPEDVQKAVEAANNAQLEWKQLSSTMRGDMLFRAAQILEERAEGIARLVVAEVGKPITEAREEVARAVDILRYYGGEGWRSMGEVIPSQSPRTLMLFTERHPLGVVSVITPWNFPIAIPVWKIAPALVFGNTVVFKPAEQAAMIGRAFVRVLEEAGIPEGVLNMITGSGRKLGPSMIESSSVSGVTFTGSTQVGLDIAKRCASLNKKYQLEMGGKNAQIVLADADLDFAVQAALSGAMSFAGQKCTACSRVIVDQRVSQEFESLLLKNVEKYGPQDPGNESTVMGPVISDQQRRWVWEKVQSAIEQGGRHLFGEGPVELNKGYFLSPTILTDINPSQEIAQEELFAPVLGIIKVDGVSEAITAANSVKFGLSASVFTRDLDLAFHCARSLEAGMVRVNSETTGVEPQAPFGGDKMSSSHSREQGRAAIEFFTQTRTVTLQKGK